MRFRTTRWLHIALLAALAIVASPTMAAEQTPALPQAATQTDMDAMTDGINTLWVVLAAALVFFMQAGFGMLEAGFLRAKNTCNILMKNFIDYCVASLMFYVVGYSLLFGDESQQPRQRHLLHRLRRRPINLPGHVIPLGVRVDAELDALKSFGRIGL